MLFQQEFLCLCSTEILFISNAGFRSVGEVWLHPGPNQRCKHIFLQLHPMSRSPLSLSSYRTLSRFFPVSALLPFSPECLPSPTPYPSSSTPLPGGPRLLFLPISAVARPLVENKPTICYYLRMRERPRVSASFSECVYSVEWFCRVIPLVWVCCRGREDELQGLRRLCYSQER